MRTKRRLLAERDIEAPVDPFPATGQRLLRIWAQAYNHLGQYERLAEVLARK